MVLVCRVRAWSLRFFLSDVMSLTRILNRYESLDGTELVETIQLEKENIRSIVLTSGRYLRLRYHPERSLDIVKALVKNKVHMVT